MRFSSRKLILATAAMVAVVVPAGLAWGCVALVAFKVNGSGIVQPGGKVEVFAGEFARGKPVQIRLDSPTGPVLTTFADPQPSTMTSQFTTEVPIPQDITPGQHFLVATQDHYDMNVGIPARAAIYVNAAPPAAPLPADRASTLAVEDPPSATTYVLIGLGVAVAGLLLAGVASLVAGRKPSEPEGARASTGSS